MSEINFVKGDCIYIYTHKYTHIYTHKYTHIPIK